MSPTFILVLRIVAMVCFALSGWMAVEDPDHVWRRLVSVGLFFGAASFISW